jgi:signal transduction histidine kinase
MTLGSQERAMEYELVARELTKLHHNVIVSLDDERRQLAQAVHDGPLQSLAAQLLALERAKRRIEMREYEKASGDLEQVREIAKLAISDLRGILASLYGRLLDHNDTPVEALSSLLEEIRSSTSLQLSLTGEVEGDLPEEISSCLYQLAWEVLDNIKAHAQAKRVEITLHGSAEAVRLAIKDDGNGFDYDKGQLQTIYEGHLGLYNMREGVAQYSGQMRVRSSPGQGTEVEFVLPVRR